MNRFIENEKGVSTIIGFMFILASIVLYTSVAYPAMIKKDIKNAESEAMDNIESKMLIFSDDIQSNRTGQVSFQLTEMQKYSSTSSAAMVFSPYDDSFTITITTPRGSLTITPGTLTIKPKNIFAQDRTIAFQAGVMIEQQGKNSWSNAVSFFSITGRNVSAQIPVITGDYFSAAGGIRTLKYNYKSTIYGAFQDTRTRAAIEIDTPYPQVFENIFKNDMKMAGFTSPADYILTNTTRSVTLNLYNLDTIGIDIVTWTVK
jgi:hypothetical protein